VILVDTSVWIDLFNDTSTVQTKQFESIIEQNDDICITGIVYTEIPQGIRDESQYKTVKQIVDELIYVEIDKETHEYAAQIYQSCRKKGITIRKPVDCIIAATCIRASLFLLHNDRYFVNISRHFPIQFI
jgi:predicted nucleic acid-binding protein